MEGFKRPDTFPLQPGASTHVDAGGKQRPSHLQRCISNHVPTAAERLNKAGSAYTAVPPALPRRSRTMAAMLSSRSATICATASRLNCCCIVSAPLRPRAAATASQFTRVATLNAVASPTGLVGVVLHVPHQPSQHVDIDARPLVFVVCFVVQQLRSVRNAIDVKQLGTSG